MTQHLNYWTRDKKHLAIARVDPGNKPNLHTLDNENEDISEAKSESMQDNES